MMKIRDTISFLYPNVTADTVSRLADRIESGILLDFHEPELQRLRIEDFFKTEIQERLIQTLVVEAHGGEVGPVLAIMDQLEINSAGTIDFKELGEENRTFYLRFYAAAGTLVFEELGDLRQRFLFGTFFLPLMVSYESHLYTTHIQRYFAKFCYVRLLEEARDNLVNAIERNITPIGTSTSAKTISEWAADYQKTRQAARDTFDEFLKDEKKFVGLNAFEKIILQQIVFIYHKLVTGEIWREVKYHLCTHATETEPHVFNFESFYLERLKNSPNISTWLEKYEEALPWLEQRDVGFISRLFAVLQQKIDLDKNQDQVVQLLNLVNRLPSTWREIYENLIMFDETKQMFVWNQSSA